MLLPVGHESNTVRRTPWFSYGIMGLCFLIHLAVHIFYIKPQESQLPKYAERIVTYYISYTDLEIPREAQKYFSPGELEPYRGKEIPIDRSSIDDLRRFFRADPNQEGLQLQSREGRQFYLNNLVSEFLKIIDANPSRRWGYTPANSSLATLVSHMFLHGDWWHLLFNMYFLFLFAPFLEDVWGRVIFPLFYILAGFAAAIFFALKYPGSTVPMIGASGAVAGMMGAFLIRFWKTRINYIFIIFIKIRRFAAPSWVMLPLWLINEYVNARAMDSLTNGEGGDVAYWAHVGGFLFGIAGALLIRATKIEEQVIHPKIQAEISYVNPSYAAYERAQSLVALGQKGEALELVRAQLNRDPGFSENVELFIALCLELNRAVEGARYVGRLLEADRERNDWSALYDHFRRFVGPQTLPLVNSDFRLKLAEEFVERSDLDEAEMILYSFRGEIDASASAPILLERLGDLAVRLKERRNSPVLLPLLQVIVKCPAIPLEKKKEWKIRWDTQEKSRVY